jgi:hypothetical protein
LGEQPNNFEVQRSQQRTLADQLTKSYGGDLASLEQRFKDAFARVAVDVAAEMLDDAEALCLRYLNGVGELIPAAREMVEQLGPLRNFLLAGLQSADDALLTVAMPGALSEQSNNEVREMAQGMRTLNLAIVRFALRKFPFVRWPGFPLEEILVRATDVYAVMHLVRSYLEEHARQCREARYELDVEKIWHLDLLVGMTQQRYISEDEAPLFSRIIDAQRRRATGSPLRRLETALAFAFMVISPILPGGAVAAAAALASAGIAVDSALYAIEDYLEEQMMAGTGLKTPDSAKLLSVVVGLFGATMSIRGVWKWVADLTRRVRNNPLRLPAPAEPTPQTGGGLVNSETRMPLVLTVREDGGSLWITRYVTSSARGRVLHVELHTLDASDPQDLEILAERLVSHAKSSGAGSVHIKAAPKYGKSFETTINLGEGRGGPAGHVFRDATATEEAARTYDKLLVKDVLRHAQTSAGVPMRLDLFARGTGKGVFGYAWKRRDVLQIDVLEISTPNDRAMHMLAQAMLRKYGPVTEVQFTGDYGKTLFGLSRGTFNFTVDANEEDVMNALVHIAEERWPRR